MPLLVMQFIGLQEQGLLVTQIALMDLHGMQALHQTGLLAVKQMMQLMLMAIQMDYLMKQQDKKQLKEVCFVMVM